MIRLPWPSGYAASLAVAAPATLDRLGAVMIEGYIRDLAARGLKVREAPGWVLQRLQWAGVKLPKVAP